MLTNSRHTVLYTGVTSDLAQRVREHKHKVYPLSITARYNVDHLVYYRHFDSIDESILEEKRLKGSSRQAKVGLIEGLNTRWIDLWNEDVRAGDVLNWSCFLPFGFAESAL